MFFFSKWIVYNFQLSFFVPHAHTMYLLNWYIFSSCTCFSFSFPVIFISFVLSWCAVCQSFVKNQANAIASFNKQKPKWLRKIKTWTRGEIYTAEKMNNWKINKIRKTCEENCWMFCVCIDLVMGVGNGCCPLCTGFLLNELYVVLLKGKEKQHHTIYTSNSN